MTSVSRGIGWNCTCSNVVDITCCLCQIRYLPARTQCSFRPCLLLQTCRQPFKINTCQHQSKICKGQKFQQSTSTLQGSHGANGRRTRSCHSFVGRSGYYQSGPTTATAINIVSSTVTPYVRVRTEVLSVK